MTNGSTNSWTARDYADNFANKWSSLLRNKRVEANQKRGTFAFYSWIRDSFAENKPYDRFVREILAASGDIGKNPPVAWYRQVREMNVQLEDTAQLFLGQRLQCAQCHHHPFEKWSQNDYYSFGAFFSTVGRKGRNPAGRGNHLPQTRCCFGDEQEDQTGSETCWPGRSACQASRPMMIPAWPWPIGCPRRTTRSLPARW